MHNKIKLSTAFLLLLILALGISNILYFKSDNSILGCDSGNHLFFSIEFFHETQDIFNNSNSSSIGKLADFLILLTHPVKHGTVYWPNGLNITTSIFYFAFGENLLAAKLSLLPYLLILIISTYMIGSCLGSRIVGLFAAFIASMYPLIFESSRQYQLDFPLAAMVTLCIALLIKSNSFSSRKISIFFGLSLGWAMLIKGQAILFVLWPFLIVLYNSIKKGLKLKQLQNIFLAISIASLLAAIWWGPQFKNASLSLREHIIDPHKTMESNYNIEEKYSSKILSFYVKTLPQSLSPILFVIFVFSFVGFIFKNKIRHKLTLLTWLIVPFLLFSLIFTIKDSRFLMPLLPLMAAISSWRIFYIKNRSIKTIVFIILISYTLIQFFLLSYADSNRRDLFLGRFRIFTQHTGYENVPHKEELNVDTVIEIISSRSETEKPIKIGLVNCGERSAFETLYLLKLGDKSLDPLDLFEMPSLFLSDFSAMEYILFRQPQKNPLPWPCGEKFIALLKKNYAQRMAVLDYFKQLQALLEILKNGEDDFELIAAIESGIYEDYFYYLYRRR